jgi:hypothetical protein
MPPNLGSREEAHATVFGLVIPPLSLRRRLVRTAISAILTISSAQRFEANLYGMETPRIRDVSKANTGGGARLALGVRSQIHAAARLVF